jgi:signal transduction histidine kinase
MVIAEQNHLNIIIQNQVGNAIKFTPGIPAKSITLNLPVQ